MWRVIWTTNPNLDVWCYNCEFEQLDEAREYAAEMARLYPERQWRICSVRDGIVYPKTARWRYGASDNDLYRAAYGRNKPIGGALGGLIERFDSNIVG